MTKQKKMGKKNRITDYKSHNKIEPNEPNQIEQHQEYRPKHYRHRHSTKSKLSGRNVKCEMHGHIFKIKSYQRLS